jgi:hypothetical protein
MSNSSKNATKHGCCAVGTLLLPTESAEDLHALENLWQNSYKPTTEAERHLVQELAHADWFLQRATRAYAEVEASLYAANPSPAEWTEQQDRKLGRYLRYKTAHTNNVIKCRKAVEDFRKARAAEKAAAEKAAKPNNGPIVDWQQHLRNMRAQAVSMGFVPPDAPDLER